MGHNIYRRHMTLGAAAAVIYSYKYISVMNATADCLIVTWHMDCEQQYVRLSQYDDAQCDFTDDAQL